MYTGNFEDMSNKSRIVHAILESPFFLIVFTVIPAAFVLSHLLHLKLPIPITTQMILGTVICLLICITARFVYYLIRYPRRIRYSTARLTSKPGDAYARPASDLRNELESAGYCFTDDGSYAEKRDNGYIGTLLIYGGLLILTFTGVRDNLTQFSGTIIHGLGVPTALSNPDIYYPRIRGPLASVADLPLLGISEQTFPNKEFPKGATEIVLLTKDKKTLLKEKLVSMGEPARYGSFDIYLAKLLVDASLTIRQKDGTEKSIFDDVVKLGPLWKKEGSYNYYGAFGSPETGEGDLYYDSDRNVFRIVLSRADRKIIDTEYAFQQYREKPDGDFVLKIGGIGRWSEIHVVHRRYMTAIIVGGIIALVGLIMRIIFLPKRVWLEETAEGCRVWGVRMNAFVKENIHHPES
jgi:hypothetical protein